MRPRIIRREDGKLRLTVRSEPRLDDVLARKAREHGVELGGPTEAGSHTYLPFMACRRKGLLGLTLAKDRGSDGRDIGTLCHACLCMHYRTGGQRTWEPLDWVRGEFPTIADEAERLLTALFARCGHEERRTWEVLGVERAARAPISGSFWERGKRVSRRGVISCRYDLIIRIKGEGVYPVDHKFVRMMARAYLTGFGMNVQFLHNALVWRRAGLEREFGPMAGYIATVVSRGKEPKIERVRVAIEARDLERYEKLIRPWAARLAWWREKRALREEDFPMNLAACLQSDGITDFMCEFWEYCESHGALRALYEEKPEREAA